MDVKRHSSPSRSAPRPLGRQLVEKHKGIHGFLSRYGRPEGFPTGEMADVDGPAIGAPRAVVDRDRPFGRRRAEFGDESARRLVLFDRPLVVVHVDVAVALVDGDVERVPGKFADRAIGAVDRRQQLLASRAEDVDPPTGLGPPRGVDVARATADAHAAVEGADPTEVLRAELVVEQLRALCEGGVLGDARFAAVDEQVAVGGIHRRPSFELGELAEATGQLVLGRRRRRKGGGPVGDDLGLPARKRRVDDPLGIDGDVTRLTAARKGGDPLAPRVVDGDSRRTGDIEVAPRVDRHPADFPVVAA